MRVADLVTRFARHIQGEEVRLHIRGVDRIKRELAGYAHDLTCSCSFLYAGLQHLHRLINLPKPQERVGNARRRGQHSWHVCGRMRVERALKVVG